MERIWNHDKIAYGGDYNPEQWPEEIWHEDMRMFKLAHINTVNRKRKEERRRKRLEIRERERREQEEAYRLDREHRTNRDNHIR